MKHLFTFLLSTLALVSVFGQSPENINFQGIVRDQAGMAIANTEVAIVIDIVDNSGTVEYTEEHSATTNIAGLYTLGIGSGDQMFGDFQDINWGQTKNINVSIDITNNGIIDIEFTSPFYSVPYALYAKDVENKDDADADATNEIQQISIIGEEIILSSGGSILLPTDNVNDADADPNNELQQISINGNQITLSSGGSIILPADNVNDTDADSQNEIQELGLVDDLLSISNANSVDLSKYKVIVGSSAQDVPTSPIPGQLYYDEICNSLFIYNANLWAEVPLNAGVADIYDKDGDGIPNSSDNCITTYNPDQSDIDGDGIGDVCEEEQEEEEEEEGLCDTSSNALDEFNSDAVTISFDGEEITIESNGLPNHTSPYYAENNSLYIDPVIADENQMSPGNITERSFTLTVPCSPQIAANSTATGLGAIGIAVSGVPIFNDEEGPNIALSENVASGFDYAGGHMGPTGYHYHLESSDVPENTELSFDDEKLVGILQDGFLLYGRRDIDGSFPTDLDESGGHFGVTPHSNGKEVYHYHIINEFYIGSYIVLFGVDLKGTPNAIL